MAKSKKLFPICCWCGWGGELTSPDIDACVKCGKPLLYGCPVCGSEFITKGQKYCGHKDCPAKSVPLALLPSLIKDGKYKPLNQKAEEFLKPFLQGE